MLTDFRQRRKDSSDRLYCFGENGEESISEDYLQKCWSQIKENKLLKIQFATWYKMTAPLVFYATERGKGKGDNGSNKEGLDDDTELDYGDEDDKDSDLESQKAQTQNIKGRTR